MQHHVKNMIPILVLNQLKNQQFMICYSSFQFILLKVSLSSEKLASQQSLYYNQNSTNIFLLPNCPMKIKVIQAQSNWFVFKEALAYKRQWCSNLCIPDMNR